MACGLHADECGTIGEVVQRVPNTYFRHWLLPAVPSLALFLLASARPLLHSALFHPICFSLPPIPSPRSHPHSLFAPYAVIFFDRTLFVSTPSHNAHRHWLRDLSRSGFLLSLSFSLSLSLPLYFSLFLSCCLYLYLPPSLLHHHIFTLTHYRSIHHLRPEKEAFLLFVFVQLYIFHSSFPTLLLPLDAVLKLEPICFISSWSSWQGPFCWRTTLSTRTPSQCTSRAFSALTNLTPSHTQDRRTTARHRRYSSTRWSPPSPQ